jgi:hypothetical protein
MLIVVLISQTSLAAEPLMILQDPVVSIRGRDRAIPRTLADVLDRALSEKPKDRYQKIPAS